MTALSLRARIKPTALSLHARIKPGLIGPPVNLSIGSVITGDAGTAAAVAISGDPPDQVLAFTLPRGSTGEMAGPGASVDGEIALFDGIDGTTLKRANQTGVLKAAAGVLSAAVAGTDYYNPGGTDVAVADGGTGASTAAGARQNLGLAYTGTVAGRLARFTGTTGEQGQTTGLFEDSSGRVGVGGVAAPEGPLHILRGAASPVHERSEDATAGVAWENRRARGTPGAKTTVLEGDTIQAVYGRAWDGAAYVACCNLRWVVDGPPSAGDVPTRIEFWTFTPGVGYGEKMRVTKDGNVGIGTMAPTCRVHSDGPIRCGSYTVGTVPSASAVGAGAQIYVTNESGGAVLAFSDGTNWLRVTDRAVIT